MKGMKTLIAGALLLSTAVFVVIGNLDDGGNSGPRTELAKKQYEPAVMDHAVYVVEKEPVTYVLKRVIPVRKGKVILLMTPIETAHSPPAEVSVNDNARIRAADL